MSKLDKLISKKERILQISTVILAGGRGETTPKDAVDTAAELLRAIDAKYAVEMTAAKNEHKKEQAKQLAEYKRKMAKMSKEQQDAMKQRMGLDDYTTALGNNRYPYSYSQPLDADHGALG